MNDASSLCLMRHVGKIPGIFLVMQRSRCFVIHTPEHGVRHMETEASVLRAVSMTVQMARKLHLHASWPLPHTHPFLLSRLQISSSFPIIYRVHTKRNCHVKNRTLKKNVLCNKLSFFISFHVRQHL